MKKIYNPTNNASINTNFGGKQLILNCGETLEFSDNEANFLFKQYPFLIEVNNFIPTNFRSDDIATIEKFKKCWAKFNNDIGLLRNKRGNKFLIIGDKRHEIPNPETRNALGYDISDFPLDEKYLDSLFPGENVTDVIKAKLIRNKNNPDPVYVVFTSPKYEKRHIPDEKTLFAIRRQQKEVEYLTEEEFNKIPEDEELRSVDKWDTPKARPQEIQRLSTSSSKQSFWDKYLIPIIIGIIVTVIGGIILSLIL